MRKLLVLFLVSSFMLFSCDKKEDNNDEQTGLNPKKVQWGWVINYTATWCGYCGSWGAPLIHDLFDLGNVVAMTAHASGDPMYNATLYSGFSSDRPTGGGIPAFYVGDNKTGQSDSEGAMTTLKNQTPIAGIDFTFNKSGNQITIKAQVKFFDGTNGDYYLNVYLLEDGIDGSTSAANDYQQSGVSNPDSYQHDYVLRASGAANVYGEMIASGDITANSTYDKTFTIDIDASWVDVYPVACLWKYDNTGSPTYLFVNAFMK